MSRTFLVLASLGLLAGCSVTTSDLTPSGSTSGNDDGSAVSASALSGTIAGKAFTAVTAIRDSAGYINIYDYATTCAEQKQPADGDVGILFSADQWTAGSSYELSFSHSVTFVEYPSSNDLSDTGRLEIVSIGDANTPAVIRLRASTGNANVQGQVSVLNCTE